MSMKKYAMTDDTIEIDGHILHRIEASINGKYFRIGDKGGFIETEDNLSHYGDCWIFGDGKVYENSKILDNVLIHDNVIINGNAMISGNIKIYGNSVVTNNVELSGNTEIYSTKLFGDCYIS